MLSKEEKDRLKDFFDPSELIELIDVRIEDVIDAFEIEIEDALDDLNEIMGVETDND